MKISAIILAAIGITLPAAAGTYSGVKSSSPEGFHSRGILMYDNSNYMGSTDQMSHLYMMEGGEQYSEDLYNTYNAGKMRNCLQFMYAGELLNVKVRCKKQAEEAFKDRLPNHWLIKDEGEYKVYGARVFGEGFVKWALSQGCNMEILEPRQFRERVKSEIKKIYDLYK